MAVNTSSLGVLDVHVAFDLKTFPRLSNVDTEFRKNSTTFGTPLFQHLLFFKAILHLAGSVDSDFDKRSFNNDKETVSPELYALLTKAIVRFGVWLEKVIKPRESSDPLILIEVPPLDVLMILHAYMISPWSFEEDSQFFIKDLRKIPHFSLNYMETLVDLDGHGAYVPTVRQKEYWKESTGGLPFFVTEVSDTATTPVKCPACGTAFEVPWRDSGTGFADQGFSKKCTNSTCGFQVTNETLGVRRFLDDLRAAKNTEDRYMSGTTMNGTGTFDLKSAAKITAELAPALTLQTLQPPSLTLMEVKKSLKGQSNLNVNNLDRLLRPYSWWWPYGADLLGKAMSQLTFAKVSRKAELLTNSILLGEETKPLDGMINSYRLFLKSYLYLQQATVSPRHRTDIVWHTHQLYPTRYRDHTRGMLGSFVNHVEFDRDFVPTQAELLLSRQWRDTLVSRGLKIDDSVIFPALLWEKNEKKKEKAKQAATDPKLGRMNESDFKVQGYNSKNFSGFSGGARAAAATATDPDDDEDDDEEAECGHGKPCVSSDGASDTFLVQTEDASTEVTPDDETTNVRLLSFTNLGAWYTNDFSQTSQTTSS